MPFTDLNHRSLDSGDLSALAVFYQTHPIPYRFDAGVVVASILVSFLGTSTTLLLLSRRTATKGLRNWALLFLAAVTMASVGVWGMHFIGMNMVLQPSPEVSWHIHFNPGFTVLSLFVPMLALVLAFVFVGAGSQTLSVDEHEGVPGNDPNADLFPNKPPQSQPFWARPIGGFLNTRIIVGGILVGGTVALMHYSSGFAASFRREYNAFKLGMSIVLACCASTTSLAVFFRFQSQWQDNWWKRLACASLLSTGVCGMHYLGLSGTNWFVPLNETHGFYLGKKASVVLTVAISVMSFGVCIVALIILLSDFLMARESRRKARRVVIASATFDQTGRVLVNFDGMLPMCEDIIQELHCREPTFQWLCALSWDWTIIEPIMSRISARLLGSDGGKSKSKFRAMRFGSRSKPESSYASSKGAAQVTLFKDHCLAATRTLSREIGIPMSKMGHFFDSFLRTGTRVMPPVNDNTGKKRVRDDEESSIYNFTTPVKHQQGVMLFLVRELSGVETDTVESYLRRGFRFAEPRWLSPIFADRAGVPKSESDGLLDQLRVYARHGMNSCVRSGGNYLGFFAVRPSISRQGGVDCLVYSFARHQIPAYRLPDVVQITDEMRAWVVSMSGRSMKEIGDSCLKDVDIDFTGPTGKQAEDMWIFKSSLILAMDALTKSLNMFHQLPETTFLSAEIIDVPSSDDDSADTASMIIFQAAFPAPIRHGHELPRLALPHEVSGTHQKQDPMPTFTFVPYTLFVKAQMMMLRGSAARKFAKDCRSDLMKRYSISPEDFQACSASPQGCKSTPVSSMLVDLSHSEQFDNEEKVQNEGFVFDKLALRASELRDTPAKIEARVARRRTSAMARMTSKSIPPSHTHIFMLDEIASSSSDFDGPAAPAYSPTRAPDYLRSPLRSGKGVTKHPRWLNDRLIATARCPETLKNEDLKGMPSVRKRSLSSGRVPSGSSFVPVTLPAHRSTCSLTMPHRVAGDHVWPDYPPYLPSHSHSGSGTILCAPISKPAAQPLAIAARLRSDDWYSRCMDGLERSPAGKTLLGVDW